jgi:hypothetical protein
MKTRLLALIVGLICVSGFLLAAFIVPVLPRSQPFNLSRTLLTGTNYSNGQSGCGSNETVREAFPPDGIVSYRIAQNQTNDSVNLWTYSDWSYSFMNIGYGGGLNGTFSSDDYTFVFQACGSTPTVSFGFWGSTDYSVPLL